MDAIIGIMKGFAIQLLVKVARHELTEDDVRQVCFKAGQWVSTEGREKLGVGDWEQLETLSQDYINAGVVGLNNGLNADDAT